MPPFVWPFSHRHAGLSLCYYHALDYLYSFSLFSWPFLADIFLYASCVLDKVYRFPAPCSHGHPTWFSVDVAVTQISSNYHRINKNILFYRYQNRFQNLDSSDICAGHDGHVPAHGRVAFHVHFRGHDGVSNDCPTRCQRLHPWFYTRQAKIRPSL